MRGKRPRLRRRRNRRVRVVLRLAFLPRRGLRLLGLIGLGSGLGSGVRSGVGAGGGLGSDRAVEQRLQRRLVSLHLGGGCGGRLLLLLGGGGRLRGVFHRVRGLRRRLRRRGRGIVALGVARLLRRRRGGGGGVGVVGGGVRLLDDRGGGRGVLRRGKRKRARVRGGAVRGSGRRRGRRGFRARDAARVVRARVSRDGIARERAGRARGAARARPRSGRARGRGSSSNALPGRFKRARAGGRGVEGRAHLDDGRGGGRVDVFRLGRLLGGSLRSRRAGGHLCAVGWAGCGACGARGEVRREASADREINRDTEIVTQRSIGAPCL